MFLSTTLLQQPWWWITMLLWICLLILVALLQMLRLPYMTTIPSLLHKRSHRLKEEQKKQEALRAWKEHCAQRIPQLVAAFELPFQHMGVHTGDFRREIEEAITTLYRLDGDQQLVFLCLQHLLQAAKQNWTGLAAFSPREREILQLLLQDISYKEMSQRLHVSPSTIKTHIYHVFQKLDVSNREDAVSFIRQRGWFFLDDAHGQKALSPVETGNAR